MVLSVIIKWHPAASVTPLFTSQRLIVCDSDVSVVQELLCIPVMDVVTLLLGEVMIVVHLSALCWKHELHQ